MSASVKQGAKFEEALRDYFLRSGYYVVRGPVVLVGDQEATDIDLWLYMRISAVARERVNVDARERRKSGAAERIFWARGVQQVLGLDRCIVATTDRRTSIKDFAHQHGILVLDGSFLGRLPVSSSSPRLSEEEFLAACQVAGDNSLFGRVSKDLRAAKARLLTSLDFDGCNEWLRDIERYARAAMVTHHDREPALRLLYFHVSMFLIGFDYSVRVLSFDDIMAIRQLLTDAFRFGNRGKQRFDEALDTGSALFEKIAPELGPRLHSARRGIYEALDGVRAEVLSDHFHLQEVRQEVFATAKAFEALAYARSLTRPSQAPPALLSVLGVLADYLNVDRKTLLTLS